MVLAGCPVLITKGWLSARALHVRGGVSLIDHFIKDIILPHGCQKEERMHACDGCNGYNSLLWIFCFSFSSFDYSFGTFIYSRFFPYFNAFPSPFLSRFNQI